MKRKLLLATILLTMFSLSACGENDKKAVISVAENSTESSSAAYAKDGSPDAEATVVDSEIHLANIENLDEQIEAVQRNYELWIAKDDIYPYYYAITDLDNNGRIEIISTTEQGTGFYTYTDIYEVNEEFLAIEPVNWEKELGESEPDIYCDSWFAAYDATTDTYEYYLYDVLRISVAENYVINNVFSLKDGIVTNKCVGYQHALINEEAPEDEPSTTMTYYDENDEEISESDYVDLFDKEMEGKEEMILYLGWTTEPSTDALRDSAEEFSVVKSIAE